MDLGGAEESNPKGQYSDALSILIARNAFAVFFVQFLPSYADSQYKVILPWQVLHPNYKSQE
jgi:hypothetical protein